MKPRIDSFEQYVLKNRFDSFYNIMWSLATGVAYFML